MGGRPAAAYLLVNFSLLRHRLQTRKTESSVNTRPRLRAPPKMGQSSRKGAGGAVAPKGQDSKSDLAHLHTSPAPYNWASSLPPLWPSL